MCWQSDVKGDEVFYMENGRPAAEFVACLYLTYTRKYKRRLKVNTTKIVYNVANYNFIFSIELYAISLWIKVQLFISLIMVFVTLSQVIVNNNLVYYLSGKEKVLTLDEEAQNTGFHKLNSNRASLRWRKK